MIILEEFLDSAKVLSLDDAVTKQTITLRRQHKKLKLGDALIAATALTHGLTILTHNIKDFRNIPGLIVVDPYSL